MSFKQRFKQLKTDWRNARLRWCKTWLDRAPAAAPAPNPHNLRAILFLRQDGKIGDYIVSSFAFREIKKANPAIKIGVVCSAKTIRILMRCTKFGPNPPSAITKSANRSQGNTMP